jgi:Protein of unknown function DUF262/Protein of unknown function (DUF1524)
MKAEAYPLKTIFGRDVRYVVPLYQRPYVWRKESHWQPLWEDVLAVVQQWLSRDHRRGVEISPHFLGAVVLDQKLTPAGSIEERHIIDGQQRLTTLQLMLAAASDTALREGHKEQAQALNKLIFNNSDLITSPDDGFKVRPTNIDRSAYDWVMSGSETPTISEDHPIGFSLVQEAYSFFSSATSAWLRDATDSESPENRIHALVETLRMHIHVVVIDLEPRDNAQVIFETLNARGTPLLAIDLVKNLIFLRAQDSDDDVGHLYRKYWRGFERWYWREDVRQGRLKRPRAELFLMHWLGMKTLDIVGFHHLYSTFRGLTTQVPPSEIPILLAEFARDGQIFESFDDREPGTPEHRFFERVRAMDTSVLLPLVLFLFRQRPGVLSSQQRNLVLSALESWLVRRMICGWTAKAYNRIVLELIKATQADPGRAATTIIHALKEGKAETNEWPTDAYLDEALANLPMYRRLPQARIRMILGAIENEMSSEKTEEMLLNSPSLTLEHLLPQAWHANYPLDETSSELQEERNRILHTIGNLTLVTKKLNPAISNGPWNEKRAALNAHSVLLMNRELVDSNVLDWSETEISRRTGSLGEYIKRIWPGPDADWSLPARESQLRVQAVPSDTDASLPSPEALIKRFAKGEAEYILEQLIDEMSMWDGVRIWVGKAAKDEGRNIYVSRRGSGLGAFCQLHPKSAEMRLLIDPDEISFMKYGHVLDKGRYRVVVSVRTTKVFSEALDLARLAYAESQIDGDEQDNHE